MKHKSRLMIIGACPDNKRYLITRCKCGTIKNVREDHIKSGKTLSCGCLKSELAKKRMTKHGESNSPEYNTWKNMHHRCNNKSDLRYYDYGGRGIKICDEWYMFGIFLKDMGRKPFKGAQIERLDNYKGYNKDNCIWATRKQNQRNMRSNNIIEYNGESKTIAEFAEIYNINYSTLIKRISRSGYSVKKAIETPVISKKKNQTV